MLGISTCWWENSYTHGEEIINDAINFGLNAIELDYRITGRIYSQMKPRLNKDIKVQSIHNYFPRPEERSKEKPSGDIFLLSSDDKEERSFAIEFSKRTIDHANNLGVAPVVLHLGRVEMQNPIEGFKKLFKLGKIGTEESKIFINDQKKIRESKQQKNIDSVLFSLEKLNREAEKKGVVLCIENRYYFHEIPSFEEIGLIMKEFEGGSIRYWHDLGHADVQSKLGILEKFDLLEAYSENLAGIHIHDVNGLDDHFSPGFGDVDFTSLKGYLKPSTVKILEIHNQRSKRDDLIKGIKYIESVFT